MDLNPVRSILAGALALGGLAAQAATPAELQAGYAAQAGTPGVAARGEQFFSTRQGREWSCATCHGARADAARQACLDRQAHRRAWRRRSTPSASPMPAKVEKWFRRNCNDVVGRECSAAEKADVLAWLNTLKP